MSSPGLALLLDLSHAGFAAVLDDAGGRVLAASSRPAGTRHDDVADWTESLLKEADGGFADLAWIAVGVGPGSFTGIRIAMAFAQGLALPRGLPLHGFTSFEALHLSAPTLKQGAEGRGCLAVIPANAGRFYVSQSLEDPGALLAGEELAAMADAGRVIVAPEITPALRELATASGFGGPWSPGGAPGETWDAAAIAGRARSAGRGADKPVYLQLSAAEEKFGTIPS